ncbi:MAG: response regulator [Phycisphaerales bacterium JB065]
MSHKVLIIDDEWTIALALSARLKAHGYKTHTAPDGISGLNAASELVPDAIILDLRMPDIDGLEVHRRLRDNDELSHIPVIFLTANIADSVRQQAMAGGAAGFYSKPYQADEILEALHKAIDASKQPTDVP